MATEEAHAGNKGFAIARVPCFADTFVQGRSSVLRIKFSAKHPRNHNPNIMASHALLTKLNNYSNKLIALYGRSNKLPATIIGAEFQRLKKVDKSGSIPNPISPYLKRELENNLGPLGTVCQKYRIGCCCEVHASNQIFLTPNIITNTKNIVFTSAKRPRTNQVINRCRNCQTVFG